MRRLALSFLVLAFSVVGVVIAPQQSLAAPLPAAYSGAAGGDEIAIDLDVTDVNATDLADARFAVTQSTVVGGTTPTSTARASNLAATLAEVGITPQSESQTAPPDNPSADSGTILAQSEPGLLDLGLLTTSVRARSEAAIACVPGGGVIANSQIQSAGLTVDPTDVGTAVESDDSTTNGYVGILPEPLSNPLNRAILSVASGSISGTSFLDGAVEVDIAGNSTLQAFATGEPGGANVTYNPGTVTVTVSGTATTVAPGGTQTFDVPGGQVIITANELTTVTESADGQTATGAVAVVTAQVRVGPAGTPEATATVDLLPLRASAIAPSGGIDCPPPPPVLNTPADGSTTADTTPTFTGTAAPGADVEVFVDEVLIGTTTAGSDGTFTLAPITPLPEGDYTATAIQITDGGRSEESNANDFTITEPPVLEDPADGTYTNDTTPTFPGTALPGVAVEIFLDGVSIGTTTADGDGEFSFTPATPLAPGRHDAYVIATDGTGDVSPQSNDNGFIIEVDDPAPPVITSPGDGTTADPTVSLAGTAEPGSKVINFVDGEEVGSTVAEGNGEFALTLSGLSSGQNEITAVAVDKAGNRSAASAAVTVAVLGNPPDADDDDDADDDPPSSLAATGGPQGWLVLAGALGVLAGAGILTIARGRGRTQARL